MADRFLGTTLSGLKAGPPNLKPATKSKKEISSTRARTGALPSTGTLTSTSGKCFCSCWYHLWAHWHAPPSFLLLGCIGRWVFQGFLLIDLWH